MTAILKIKLHCQSKCNKQHKFLEATERTYINADIYIPSVSITVLCETVSHLHNQPFTVDRQDSLKTKE